MSGGLTLYPVLPRYHRSDCHDKIESYSNYDEVEVIVVEKRREYQKFINVAVRRNHDRMTDDVIRHI